MMQKIENGKLLYLVFLTNWVILKVEFVKSLKCIVVLKKRKYQTIFTEAGRGEEKRKIINNKTYSMNIQSVNSQFMGI